MSGIIINEEFKNIVRLLIIHFFICYTINNNNIYIGGLSQTLICKAFVCPYNIVVYVHQHVMLNMITITHFYVHLRYISIIIFL